ncbi:MAG: hypothetical protein NZ902_03810 [Acidilobaceae archaeon]|nr:hypothetical protein [Acidilobaceae archaeon]MCX8165145.1 hypothetical protein [Acidilobaceae archaeon]MDW7974339.1 hypothetical protein [Sulfolobales archaeon]
MARVTVEGSTRAEVRRALDRAHRRGVIMAVRPRSLDALRYSSVSKSVHIIRVEQEVEKFIDKSEARLFKSRGWGALELSLNELRGRQLSLLYNVSHKAHALDLNLVISSDASSAEELWSPLSVIGLLSSFGIPSWRAKSWITSVPSYVMDRILA